jgi:hypothetical protein
MCKGIKCVFYFLVFGGAKNKRREEKGATKWNRKIEINCHMFQQKKSLHFCILYSP